jgi:hypothetical protein
VRRREVRDDIPVLGRREHSQFTEHRAGGRRLARVCEADKLEELVTEWGMISNV